MSDRRSIPDWARLKSKLGDRKKKEWLIALVFVLPAKSGDTLTPFFTGKVLVHLLSGGLFLGAFFMATDMVTSPMTRRGQVIFGMGCGVLTSLIRLYGGYPEGVCYAILLMNTASPLIDRYTKRKVFGKRPKSHE